MLGRPLTEQENWQTVKKFIFALSLVASLLGVFAVAGCRSETVSEHDKPVIYASFYPIYSMVRDIAGDVAEVHSFMPDGQDPHLWEPTPANIKDLAAADLLVVNGANMEPWLPHIRDVLPNLRIIRLSDYVELINYKGAAALGEFQFMGKAHFKKNEPYTIVFGHTHERNMRGAFFEYDPTMSQEQLIARGREALSSQGDKTEQESDNSVAEGEVYDMAMGHESGRITFTFPREGDWVFVSDRVSENLLTYHFVDKDGHKVDMPPVVNGGSSKTDHSTFDPHSWLSVVNAKRYANALSYELTQMYPHYKKSLHDHKVTFVKALTTMQAQFAHKLRHAPRRSFVTSHNAFAYMARDYGLTQHALQGLTTNEAPTLRVLVDAIRFARQQGITVVYYEYGTDPKTATVVADEIGGRALPLNSMEYGSSGTAHEDKGYIAYMQMNLENLYESLS